MTSKQVYDKDGTTNFQFTFIDKSSLKKKNRPEWHVFFTQGFISIHDCSKDTRIRVNFPEMDHWVYTEREAEFSCGAICTGAEIKTKDFTLTIDVREYKDSDDPEFDTECDEEGENMGYLDLDTKIGRINMTIPYKLALNLMKFMAGSTDLVDICGVHKSK
jgi:hypothetical protein